jgi:Tfp pilus assembly protein PilP
MMNPKRTATIVVVGGALLAWLAGAATSNRAIEPAPVISIPAIDNSGVALEKEIARLHERLRPTATPAQSNRNLFSFRSAPVRAVPAPRAPAAPALVEAPPLPPPLPPLKLVGVAEDAGADGPARTAIVVGDGQLYTVKEGENVTARYRVTRISADVVELLDLNDNSLRRLALR